MIKLEINITDRTENDKQTFYAKLAHTDADDLIAGEGRYKAMTILQALEERKKAAEELLKAIRADAGIAEFMRDYWRSLNSGAEK